MIVFLLNGYLAKKTLEKMCPTKLINTDYNWKLSHLMKRIYKFKNANKISK